MAISNDTLLVTDYLQNASILYKNAGYVADQLFPIIDGLNPTAKVAKYHKGPWFRDSAEPRAPGSAARVAEFKVTSTNLDPINYAIAGYVPDEERRNASLPTSMPINPDIDLLVFLADQLDIKKEIRGSAVLMATDWSGLGAGGATAAAAWGHATAASDTFLADTRTARDTVLANTGLLCNTLFINWPTWSKLQVAPALLALMNPQQLTANSLVTVSSLSGLIGMEVIVGSAVKNSDEETVDDSFTSAYIWGESGSETNGIGFIYYKPPTVGLRTASAGYQYRIAQDNGQGRMSTTWRDDARHSDGYDSQENVDLAAVGTDLGYLWYDTVSTS